MAFKIGDIVTTHWGDGTVVKVEGSWVYVELDSGSVRSRWINRHIRHLPDSKDMED